MRILLVKDPEQLEPLQVILTHAGHIVDGVEAGQTAQWLFGEKAYDLLILDWMLPEISGLELCRQYRQAGRTALVLILTAKDTLSDKISGLDEGADDYLVKPIDLVELLARVQALRRRSPFWVGKTLEIADLKLHTATLTIERRDITVQFSSREFQLLEYLLRHPRQVLTSDRSEQALWNWRDEPGTYALTTLVKRLRQRLRKVRTQEWIEAVYGMGDRFAPPENP